MLSIWTVFYFELYSAVTIEWFEISFWTIVNLGTDQNFFLLFSFLSCLNLYMQRLQCEQNACNLSMFIKGFNYDLQSGSLSFVIRSNSDEFKSIESTKVPILSLIVGSTDRITALLRNFRILPILFFKAIMWNYKFKNMTTLILLRIMKKKTLN